jgi:hypothetical protein
LITQAKAGVVFEPYFGISSSQGKSILNSTEQYNHEYSGRAYGIKMSLVLSSFYFGIDYNKSDFIMDTSQNNLGASDLASMTRMGLVFGKRLNAYWRMFINYSTTDLIGKDETKSSGQFINANQNYNGMSYGLGISRFIGKNSSLNLTYMKNSFSKLTSNSIENNNVDLNFSEVLISVALYFGK